MIKMIKNISDDYIAGFVDGEGCFALSMRKDVRHERKSKATYYSWKASFAINLRADDAALLKCIQNRLGVGSVTFTKDKTSVRFQVSDLYELRDVIVPFFELHTLYGKKGRDFKLWSEAIKILLKYKVARGDANVLKGVRGFQKIIWQVKDVKRLKEIQKISSEYKSKRIRKWTEAKMGRS